MPLQYLTDSEMLTNKAGIKSGNHYKKFLLWKSPSVTKWVGIPVGLTTVVFPAAAGAR